MRGIGLLILLVILMIGEGLLLMIGGLLIDWHILGYGASLGHFGVVESGLGGLVGVLLGGVLWL